ncbi:MAG: ribonuclease E/G [Clostridiales bacterium]|nr:ribonuclease E/G [Clostridiales bacterium]
MEIEGVSCNTCALEEDGHIMELMLEEKGKKSILGNIYVGQVENIAANIQAAFVMIDPDTRCYLPLSDVKNPVFSSGRTGDAPLRPGDMLLVQVSREAMKGKLPAVTTNLNFTGKYLVLTTGEKKIGFSKKLIQEEKNKLNKWLEEERAVSPREYGIVVRTNAGEASKEEFLTELSFLKRLYEKTAVYGRSRTCFSCVYETEPFYMNAVRDTYSKHLDEIVTDIPEVFEHIVAYLKEVSHGEENKVRLYEDALLPLYKLYRIGMVLEEVQKQKVWLKSGGFLVIQQTEAFVSIDVNSGKFTGKKKAEETYRKINLEAAGEIARQLRLRNLSGIILIDFINMENPDHQDELFHVLQKHLRKDSVKAKAVDITPLHILEMTRKKVRRPLSEDLKEISLR